jgi:hypothetical protein
MRRPGEGRRRTLRGLPLSVFRWLIAAIRFVFFALLVVWGTLAIY